LTDLYGKILLGKKYAGMVILNDVQHIIMHMRLRQCGLVYMPASGEQPCRTVPAEYIEVLKP
jgi:hypothetical protein